MANPTITGIRQALLEQEGGQRHGDDRGRGGQNGAEAYALSKR